jgi:hypothetical protein
MKRLLDREWGFFIIVAVISVVVALIILASVVRG